MGPIDVLWRSRIPISVAFAALAACGGTPREASRPVVAKPRTAAPASGHLKDPDLDRQPPPKLLSIDWSSVQLTSDADANALWQRIAPTGLDWSDKLDELPDSGDIPAKLAVALLHGGNFTCVPAQPPSDCTRAPVDEPEPLKDATLSDPCLRRLLAIWSLAQLEDEDLPGVRDTLCALAAIPPPESELVAAALKALPESDQDGRLELYAIAFRAGHRELVNGLVGSLDDAHLVVAVQKHHIDGAFELITPEQHRPLFVAAITDEQLHAEARVQAISELHLADGKLAPDVRAAIIRATKSPDCFVAASADRFLVRGGEKKFAPARPRTTKPAVMMRALCVLISYEAGLTPDDPSFLLGYVPKKGLELVTVTYDEYNDVDVDGDGDPHTERHATMVPRDEVALPEAEDMQRALGHCAGAVCKSTEHEFKFGFSPSGGELLLTRLEVIERPPCNKPAIPNP